jgi:hypothetical protein
MTSLSSKSPRPESTGSLATSGHTTTVNFTDSSTIGGKEDELTLNGLTLNGNGNMVSTPHLIEDRDSNDGM